MPSIPRHLPEHEHWELIETVLAMAAAEERWGQHNRALTLLNRVAEITGSLPAEFERLRARCRTLQPVLQRPR